MLSEWRKARQDVSAGGAAEQLSVGGGVRLWDILLQDWLLRLRRKRPEIALIAEAHSPELLTRKLLDGVLDLAFMLEPPQLDVLQIREVALLKLVLVADRSGLLPTPGPRPPAAAWPQGWWRAAPPRSGCGRRT